MKTKLPKLAPVVPPWLAIWCRTNGWPMPVMEYRFVEGRKFAFDFAWVERKIAIEVDGGIYGRGKPCPTCKRRPVGAHSSIKQLKSDREKTNYASSLGWRLLRVLPEECENGSALRWLDMIRMGQA